MYRTTPLRLLAAFAAAASLAAPLSALAAPTGDPALDTFVALCGHTAAEYPDVVKAADAAGWPVIEVTADTMPGVSVTDKTARGKVANGVEIQVFATRGLKQTATGPVTISTCTVTADKIPPGMLGRVSTWLPMTPMSTDTGKASYLLTRNGDSYVVLAQPDVNAAVAKGGVHLLKFKQDETGVSLDYTKIAK